MKKSILIFCSLFLSFGLLAQEEETQVKSEEKQEVKLNLLMTVIGMPEISYEYFIEDNFTVGLSLGASVVDVEDFNYRFMATPYARLYFGKKNNAGFFLEGNVAYLNLKEKYWWSYYYQQGDEVYSDSGHSTKTTNNFGVGVAVGFKLLTKNNFTGDVYLGAGRVFGDDYISSAYPRIGLSVGKRF